MSIFKDGLELLEVKPELSSPVTVGLHCEKIVVSMENGQMAAVPWAIVDGEKMFNLATAESVTLKEKIEGE